MPQTRHQLLLLLLLCLYTCQGLSSSCRAPQECSSTPLAEDSILVRCLDNLCVCNNSCFHYAPDSTEPPCVLNSACYAYSRENDTCSLLSKPLTETVLFALLLGYSGAANYYVGRYTLAIIQSVLLGVVLSCCCCTCIYTACLLYRAVDMGYEPGCPFYFGMVFIVIFVVLSLSSFVWWFVDIFLFATRYNSDGNGCPLSLS